jgi:hypothetical protein
MLKNLWAEIRKSAGYSAFNSLQIAKHALGKYIIAFGCLVHIMWAIILMIDVRAVNATPLSIIFALCQHDRTFTIIILLLVSVLAGCFLDIRLRGKLSMSALSLFLVPQQMVLMCSAFNAVYCTVAQRYSDGTPMSWPHILTDQSPIVGMALLYTVALIESRHPPERLVSMDMKGEKGDKGDKGDKGEPGTGGKGGDGGRGGDAPDQPGLPGEAGLAGT